MVQCRCAPRRTAQVQKRQPGHMFQSYRHRLTTCWSNEAACTIHTRARPAVSIHDTCSTAPRRPPRHHAPLKIKLARVGTCSRHAAIATPPARPSVASARSHTHTLPRLHVLYDAAPHRAPLCCPPTHRSRPASSARACVSDTLLQPRKPRAQSRCLNATTQQHAPKPLPSIDTRPAPHARFTVVQCH